MLKVAANHTERHQALLQVADFHRLMVVRLGERPRRVGGGPTFRAFAAGVSLDSPRAKTCTFNGPGLQKHHQNSTSRHREREK